MESWKMHFNLREGLHSAQVLFSGSVRPVRTSQLRVIQRQIESGIEGREGSGIEGRKHPHDNPSWYTCKGMDLTPPCLITVSLLETAPSCWISMLEQIRSWWVLVELADLQSTLPCCLHLLVTESSLCILWKFLLAW